MSQIFRSVLVAGGLLVATSVASAQTPAQIAAGQKVFTGQKCGLCHSVAGVGNKKGALDGVSAKLTADDTRGWIINAPAMVAQSKEKPDRKPAMKANPTLAKADADALVAYLQSLKK